MYSHGNRDRVMAKEKTETLRAGKRVTLVGAWVNTLLIVLKLLAGIFGHSQALIADAVHSVSDLFTDAVVLIGLKLGRKPPDEDHPFGHARIETLASAGVGVALVAAALYLGIKSALNLYSHAEYHPTGFAIAGAALSIVFKEVLYRYTVNTGRRIKSRLIVANAWHHRSDALSSVAVLLGVVGAFIHPAWHLLDAFAALLVSFFVIKVGLEIFRDTLREFTDTAPETDVLANISACAMSVDGVMAIHDLKARTSGGLYQMEIHIVVDGRLTVVQGHRIAKEVEKCLVEKVEDTASVIVHVDPCSEAPGEKHEGIQKSDHI